MLADAAVGGGAPSHHPPARGAGDFTATRHMIPIALLAIPLGALSALVAAALLRLIAVFTNLFFFQRLSMAAVSPAGHALGVWAVAVPVVGGLVIGLLARYGSDRIRGHGIPEALEAILIRGSRIQPRVALLKPLSSAISIGSGGPFGAEGPIIMTGGAVGSIVAQLLHLTAAERKTLLVAGAAAGMSATFAVPFAAVALAVELLLFELKPRSLVPVALASATAAAVRNLVLGPGPLFATAIHVGPVAAPVLLACVAAGIAGGALAFGLTASVYAAEDLFGHLRVHWMWWPAIGALVVGIGGAIDPRALGVGYDQIESLLNGRTPLAAVALLAIVKWTIWAVALGSGTSGGVLAPLLMLGSALGALLGVVLPGGQGPGFWPLVTMAATLAGTMRAPLTAVVFAAELTSDFALLLPLLVSAATAHAFTVLAMRRSILTEKVARRGHHVSREYAIDALEIVLVRDVMDPAPLSFSAISTVGAAAGALAKCARAVRPRLVPVIDAAGGLAGVVTEGDIERHRDEPGAPSPSGPSPPPSSSVLLSPLAPTESGRPLSEIMRVDPVIGFPDESLRVAVHRMAQHGVTVLPIVDRASPEPGRLRGTLALRDALQARRRHLHEEEKRERFLGLPLLFALARPRRDGEPGP